MIKLLLLERSIRLPDQTKLEAKHSKHQHATKKNDCDHPAAEVILPLKKRDVGGLVCIALLFAFLGVLKW
jgi:hypothetical protein